MRNSLKDPPDPPHSSWGFGLRASIALQSPWVTRSTNSKLFGPSQNGIECWSMASLESIPF